MWSRVALIFAILFSLTGQAVAWKYGSGGATVYTGQVATRTFVPQFIDTTNKQFNSRSFHIARDTITALQIAVPNWYVGSGTETSIAQTATITASIEYPAATFTQ